MWSSCSTVDARYFAEVRIVTLRNDTNETNEITIELRFKYTTPPQTHDVASGTSVGFGGSGLTKLLGAEARHESKASPRPLQESIPVSQTRTVKPKNETQFHLPVITVHDNAPYFPHIEVFAVVSTDEEDDIPVMTRAILPPNFRLTVTDEHISAPTRKKIIDKLREKQSSSYPLLFQCMPH
mmetsp:Transcript_12300/g.40203  ORF Transcript_12300/g.40203 Transcript_12300/m.40203 type:complete len:182 (+) Transcript_12300:935-1480(+)